MEERTYLNFDVRFTKDGSDYRAEVVQSPGGTGQHAFAFPFKERALDDYLATIGERRRMRRGISAANDAAREFGNKLFETVFTGELGTIFEKSLEVTRNAGNRLRIRLRLGETPELADLPWEYLYQSRRKKFLAFSDSSPVVRYFDLLETEKPLTVTPPLRVLVMLSNPSDVEGLDIEDEYKKLKEAVKTLEDKNLLVVERLAKATLEELRQRLCKGSYHIFHFVGHGQFDPQSKQSFLALEGEKGRSRLVSGPEIGNYLSDEPTLRLVVLNACEGGRASVNDATSGVAQGLVLQGIPAVIAMQFEVSDKAAIAMAGGFYSALADNYPVDAAVSEARKAIHAADCGVEWGTPVLYLHAPDGRIFDINRTEAQKVEPAVSLQPRFPAIPVSPPPAVMTGTDRRKEIEARLNEADIALAAEEFDQAQATLTQVLDIAPGDRRALAQVEAVGKQRQAGKLYGEALRHYESGDLAKARSLFLEIQGIIPDYKDVRERLTQLTQQQIDALTKQASEALSAEKFDRAEEALNDALAITPNEPKAIMQITAVRQQRHARMLYQKAMQHFESGQLEKARALFSETEALTPGYKDVRSRLAQIKQQQIDDLLKEAEASLAAENLDRAEQALEQLLRIAPGEPRAVAQMENVRLREKAEKLYCDALQNHEAGDLGKARALFLDTQSIVADYKDVRTRLAEISQWEIDGLLKQADAALAAEKFDRAEEALNEMLRISPGEPRALAQIDVVHRQRQAGTLYGEALRYQDADDLDKARAVFLRIQAIAADYKDVRSRVASIEASKAGIPHCAAKLQEPRREQRPEAVSAATTSNKAKEPTPSPKDAEGSSRGEAIDKFFATLSRRSPLMSNKKDSYRALRFLAAGTVIFVILILPWLIRQLKHENVVSTTSETHPTPYYYSTATPSPSPVAGQPGEAHPTAPHVVRDSDGISWKPAPGYDWRYGDLKDNHEVVWKADLRWPEKHVYAAEKEGLWYPDPGYKFLKPGVDIEPIAWSPGMPNPGWPHVIASDTEGIWEPKPGYKFVNPEVDLSVTWSPGTPWPGSPHVFASDTEGVLQLETGYRWLDPGDKNNLDVVRKEK